MRTEKLTRAIESAMGYLEESTKTSSKGSDDLSDLVWRAAAELEYALFLFSVMHQGEPEGSSWKLSLRSRDVELNPVLESAKDLLEEAEGKIEAGELLEAHKKTWMARGYLLKLQQFFEKKRRRKKAAKKSS